MGGPHFTENLGVLYPLPQFKQVGGLTPCNASAVDDLLTYNNKRMITLAITCCVHTRVTCLFCYLYLWFNSFKIVCWSSLAVLCVFCTPAHKGC